VGIEAGELMHDIASIFWAVTTSYIVLGLVGAILVGALVVGYFPLLKWFPVVGQYVPVGKLVSLLAMGALCGLLGVRMTAERYDAKQAAARAAKLEQRLNAITTANAADAAKALVDAAELQRLREQANQTPPNSGPCLDESAAKRIGGIK
jgi:hypothetical protein